LPTPDLWQVQRKVYSPAIFALENAFSVNLIRYYNVGMLKLIGLVWNIYHHQASVADFKQKINRL